MIKVSKTRMSRARNTRGSNGKCEGWLKTQNKRFATTWRYKKKALGCGPPRCYPKCKTLRGIKEKGHRLDFELCHRFSEAVHKSNTTSRSPSLNIKYPCHYTIITINGVNQCHNFTSPPSAIHHIR